jgi:putative nucleotidyltransferase with HDIG domain
MAHINLENKLAKVIDLPTLSVVANNIILITQNPKSSALEVGSAISQDQALVSKILRIANSTFYGFPKEITTITHAIVILGFANIRNLVLTASIVDMFPSSGGDGHFDREGFWNHSLACGVTSKLIAKRLGINNLEEVFISGLLHDLGKLILDTYFSEDFTRVFCMVEEKEILIREAEQELLGFDHAAVGGIVADKWNLPPALIKVIRFHHNPPLANESMRMAAIVHLADVLCRAIGMGNGGDSKVPCINEDSWKLLGLSRQRMKRLFSEMEKEIANAKALLALVE